MITIFIELREYSNQSVNEGVFIIVSDLDESQGCVHNKSVIRSSHSMNFTTSPYQSTQFISTSGTSVNSSNWSSTIIQAKLIENAHFSVVRIYNPDDETKPQCC